MKSQVEKWNESEARDILPRSSWPRAAPANYRMIWGHDHAAWYRFDLPRVFEELVPDTPEWFYMFERTIEFRGLLRIRRFAREHHPG